MGFTRIKRLFRPHSSRDKNNNPNEQPDRQPSRQHQPSKAAITTPGDRTSCDALENQQTVSPPQSAPSDSLQVQTCPPGEPSKSPSPTVRDSHTSIYELWNEAYKSLRDEERDLVADYETKLCGDLGDGLASALGSKVNMRERMQTVLKRKMDDINRDTWKLKFGSSEVQFEDIAKPVLGVVDWANTYIKDALSANSYASLAWGGVSLLLPVSRWSFISPHTTSRG